MDDATSRPIIPVWAPAPRLFAGSDWIEQAGMGPLSTAGRIAADLLGEVFRGIYHLSSRALRRVDWSKRSGIELSVHDGLATWDSDTLTRLVVLSHAMMCRVEICSSGPRLLKLWIHLRATRSGPTYARLPDLDDHIREIMEPYSRAASQAVSEEEARP